MKVFHKGGEGEIFSIFFFSCHSILILTWSFFTAHKKQNNYKTCQTMGNKYAFFLF